MITCPLVGVVGSLVVLKFWEISNILKMVQDEDIVTMQDQ